ncbi:MAG: hypothetical protein DRI69_12035 [Bacteroidetes bacterium]|nr:MAG: hypothetical protein DRI69_12035 [Bacteroidota bacterium]
MYFLHSLNKKLFINRAQDTYAILGNRLKGYFTELKVVYAMYCSKVSDDEAELMDPTVHTYKCEDMVAKFRGTG